MEANKTDIIFEERHDERGDLCSQHVCVNKHIWVPTMKLAQCGGCGTPVVAVKLENCPICNEPAVYTRLRIDHIGYKQPLHAICRGVPTNSEVVMAEMERKHWRETEQEQKDLPPGVEPAKKWNLGELNRRINEKFKKNQNGGENTPGVEKEAESSQGAANGGGGVDGCGDEPQPGNGESGLG